jgi:hypothetical protein
MGWAKLHTPIVFTVLVLFVAVFSLVSGCSNCDGRNASTFDAAAFAKLGDAGDGGAHSAHGHGSGVDGGMDDSAMPASSGEDLQNRMRHLLEAVSQNNPELAGDAIFPRDGYVVARDVADPQKAWEKKISLLFRKHVGRMHKKLKGVEHARFVSFELGHSIVQLTPKKKDFKKPLWRVKRSKLTFTIDGKTRQLDIQEMTAWRGAWYVTRLH